MLDVILSGRRVRHHRRTTIGRTHFKGINSFFANISEIKAEQQLHAYRKVIQNHVPENIFKNH